MSFTYGQPHRWQPPSDPKTGATTTTSFANSMAASAFSARDDKKKKKDKGSKDKAIKLVSTRPAEELEQHFQTNDMSPTIKYVELHRHATATSGTWNWTMR